MRQSLQSGKCEEKLVISQISRSQELIDHVEDLALDRPPRLVVHGPDDVVFPIPTIYSRRKRERQPRVIPSSADAEAVHDNLIVESEGNKPDHGITGMRLSRSAEPDI